MLCQILALPLNANVLSASCTVRSIWRHNLLIPSTRAECSLQTTSALFNEHSRLLRQATTDLERLVLPERCLPSGCCPCEFSPGRRRQHACMRASILYRLSAPGPSDAADAHTRVRVHPATSYQVMPAAPVSRIPQAMFHLHRRNVNQLLWRLTHPPFHSLTHSLTQSRRPFWQCHRRPSSSRPRRSCS